MGIKVNDFYRSFQFSYQINERSQQKIEAYIEFARELSELTSQSIYLVDYSKRKFIYVSDNPILLCGRSAQRVQEAGFMFFLKNVPDDDVRMLLKVNEAGFAFFNKQPISERMQYSLSYDFNLMQPKGGLLLINHKIKPLLLDKTGKPWIALCIVSSSSNAESGHIYYTNIHQKKTYNLDITTGKWHKIDSIRLTPKEKQILQYSIQGITMEQMASKLKITINTIKFHKKNIFQKLKAKNITEAAAAAFNFHLL